MTAARVTISDVARVAGVAQSTVSLVLNKRDRVSKATRRRIQEVMDQLGYVPRPNSSRPRRHVAILHGREMMFCKELVGYCREWVMGIREGLGDDKADVSVFCGGEHVSRDFMFEASLTAGDLDGLIVMGLRSYDGYLQRMMKTGLPLIVMQQLPRSTEFSSVSLDCAAAGRIAADHLVELGHQRIGLFMRPDGYPHSVLTASFLERLREHGRDLALRLRDPELTFEDMSAFDRHARRIVASGVTALFTGDPAAYRLANALQAMGVKVPGQVSLLGFDHLGLRTDAGQRLSSIDYDKREMGRRAGRMLQDLLVSGGSVANLSATFPSRLYIGQTTGPCPEAPGRNGDKARHRQRKHVSEAVVLGLNG